jgi:hypothetical protein
MLNLLLIYSWYKFCCGTMKTSYVLILLNVKSCRFKSCVPCVRKNKYKFFTSTVTFIYVVPDLRCVIIRVVTNVLVEEFYLLFHRGRFVAWRWKTLSSDMLVTAWTAVDSASGAAVYDTNVNILTAVKTSNILCLPVCESQSLPLLFKKIIYLTY